MKSHGFDDIQKKIILDCQALPDGIHDFIMGIVGN